MSPHQILHRLALTSHRVVRVLLIMLLGLWASLHLLLMDEGSDMDRKAYDQMVKQRLFTPKADPRIVVVDIDEASLEKLKNEFGRWPWPRETLAAALEWLTQQGAQAVVFDILFADQDTLNPGSDAAFVASVAKSGNSYFPILRLNPENDAVSQVHAQQLQGFTTPLSSPSTAASPTLAVTPPVFDAIVRSGRMGYHNIYPDTDGINRHYQLWEDKDNWRLWSLPARIAQDLHWPLPEKAKQLIQYTHHKSDYAQIPFWEIWQRSQSSQGNAPDARFDGAVVIIGSTATSLFDVKVSPLDVVHPGVMILANVMDNLKNQRFLQQLSLGAQLAVAWLALLLVAWSSTKIREDQTKWAIPIAPGLFLGIGFLSLHSGLNVYLDLTASASHALLFFTIWTAYLNWRTHYFSTYAPAATNAPLQTSFALLNFGANRPSMPQIYDLLGQYPEARCMAIQLGGVGITPHLQTPLVYLRLETPAGASAQQRLQGLISQLPDQPSSRFVSEDHTNHFEFDKQWSTIWTDVSQAYRRMESPS